jgi:hypothetical protein
LSNNSFLIVYFSLHHDSVLAWVVEFTKFSNLISLIIHNSTHARKPRWYILYKLEITCTRTKASWGT